MVTPIAIRKLIIDLHIKGVSKSEISRRLEVSRTTVISLIKRFKDLGDAGLLPSYHRSGNRGLRFTSLLVRSYHCLKCWHPAWGYDKISSLIRIKHPDWRLPDRRTVYRWWNRAKLVTPRSKNIPPPRPWASTLHDGWQIDAKEAIKLATGQRCCWLNIIDERSGTVITPRVFSL